MKFQYKQQELEEFIKGANKKKSGRNADRPQDTNQSIREGRKQAVEKHIDELIAKSSALRRRGSQEDIDTENLDNEKKLLKKTEDKLREINKKMYMKNLYFKEYLHLVEFVKKLAAWVFTVEAAGDDDDAAAK